MTIRVNGKAIACEEGQSVAAALMNEGLTEFRPGRLPYCGMGICMECTATINGRPGQRTCLVMCEDGMEVTFDQG